VRFRSIFGEVNANDGAGKLTLLDGAVIITAFDDIASIVLQQWAFPVVTVGPLGGVFGNFIGGYADTTWIYPLDFLTRAKSPSRVWSLDLFCDIRNTDAAPHSAIALAQCAMEIEVSSSQPRPKGD
jgi:hypothetical protein